ncbi:MAG: NUDIX hydrolase [Bacteroidales bacterium]|nr:NUDIX hydrolase [Bacteroidales bacterium]
MQSNFLFQYCQKLIVISNDKRFVLLAKRKGETDFDSTFSFIGGKMETTDIDMVAGMKREKDEEIGAGNKIKILPNETYNLYYRKKDGSCMILPHIPGIFISGEIVINHEYSEYSWVPIAEIDRFEPKIANIPKFTRWALQKINSADDNRFVEI